MIEKTWRESLKLRELVDAAILRHSNKKIAARLVRKITDGDLHWAFLLHCPEELWNRLMDVCVPCCICGRPVCPSRSVFYAWHEKRYCSEACADVPQQKFKAEWATRKRDNHKEAIALSEGMF